MRYDIGIWPRIALIALVWLFLGWKFISGQRKAYRKQREFLARAEALFGRLGAHVDPNCSTHDKPRNASAENHPTKEKGNE